MKRSVIALVMVSFILFGLTIEQKESSALISDKEMMQVGIIVKDVEKSASHWAAFLGNEEIHHIAFNIKGMRGYIENFEDHGIPMIQHGGWDTGEYSYMDGTNSLSLIIELLENYD